MGTDGRDLLAGDAAGGTAAVDLYWLPLGAGGHFVRLNGRAYEALAARMQRRPAYDLYHSALQIQVAEGTFVIEQTPVPDLSGKQRGVVAGGAVGSRWAGRFRIFRYEIRLWRDGHIPDVAEAVESPRRLTNDEGRARRVLDLVAHVPSPVWGRDELGTGEMWNSNSVIAWVIARSGIETESIQPPARGRAPGWQAGLVVARRQEEEAARTAHVEGLQTAPGHLSRLRFGRRTQSSDRRGIEQAHDLRIAGFAKEGFGAVRDAFIENFTHRNELGAACCMYHRGERVVDLWGGVRNKATGEPWEEDTMVIVFSTTKGLAGLAIALANSRGLLDYEERVCAYWPEFDQHGKEKVTVRQLLSHQAGLAAVAGLVDKEILGDLDRLAVALAEQKPAWEPGTRQGYHAITLGLYESELLRRVDPTHRSIGQFFHDEIAAPLGLDFYIGLPEEIANSRLATLEAVNPAQMLLHPSRFGLAFLNPRSLTHRAFWKAGMAAPFDTERIYARRVEVPSQGGIGTARAIAHAYSVFATGGRELGLREETLQKLMAPAVPPLHGFYDEVVKLEARLSLGFAKPSSSFPFGSPAAFGTPGAGGSLGFADPQAAVGYAYVTNKMGREMRLLGDPREMALRHAFQQAIGESALTQPASA